MACFILGFILTFFQFHVIFCKFALALFLLLFLPFQFFLTLFK